jgi:hypothetical protein
MIETDTKSLVKKAIKDKQLLSELLDRLLSKKDEIRFSSFNALLNISEEHPEVLYPKWDFLADLITSNNSYRKLIAIRLIANLTRIDTENKFEGIFDRYYSILNDKGTVTAGHLAGISGKIVKAKPKLETKITDKLLNIDKIRRGKQKELIKGYAIESLSKYFENAKDKNKIIKFVKDQLESESPKTRKKAKEFLKTWDK